MTWRPALAALRGVVALALAVAACGSDQSPAPSPSRPSPPSPSTLPTLASPTLSPSTPATPTGPPASGSDRLYATAYRPEPGRRGGELVVGDWRSLSSLNPYAPADPVTAEVLGATTRSLLTLTNDGRWATELAAEPIDGSSVTRDKRGTGFSVRVKLRPGLSWSDGEPLTMNDFRFARSWVLGAEGGSLDAHNWETVDRITVSDDGLTGTYHFADVTPDWLAVVGLNPPLPEHALADLPPSAAAAAFPLSAAAARIPVDGPFRYESAGPAGVSLVRNERWEDGGRGAYLDRLTFRTFADDKDQLESAIGDGSVDVGLGLTADDLPVLGRLPPDQAAIAVVPTWRLEHLDLNTSGAGFGRGLAALRDRAVRVAIVGAIDRAGLYAATYPLGGDQVGQACSIAPANSFWIDPEVAGACPAVDPSGAARALDETGYAPGPDGVRRDPKTGEPLTLRLCTTDDLAHHTGAQYLADALAPVGIRLEPVFVDPASVLFADWGEATSSTACNLARGTFDAALYSSSLGLDLVSDYFLSLHSSQIPSDGNDGAGFNYVRYASSRMDAALETLRSAVDPADALEAVDRVQELAAAAEVVVPLYYRPSVGAIGRRARNVALTPGGPVGIGSDLWNVEDWWVGGG